MSEVMFYLDQHATRTLLADDPNANSRLVQLCRQNGLQMRLVRLDGTVVFDSSSSSPIVNPAIDLKYDLHYDLHEARDEHDQFSIAFPVVSESIGQQVGNAIFSVPASEAFASPNRTAPLVAYLTMLGSVLMLIVLLVWAVIQFRRRILLPVGQLKLHAEAIVRGRFEEKINLGGRPDEIVLFAASFDLMRAEILHLNHQRKMQSQESKELISNISHDIKTPLTIVKAYIDAIREGACADEETIMDYLGVMQVNTDKIVRLVDDLLIHALRESGRISIELREQYSGEVLSSIIEPLAHVVRTNGMEFIGPSFIPNVLISVDTVRLEQVFSNLITNALKHTTIGDTIRISFDHTPENLTIVITDTGQGISPHDMPFIFDRYFKGKPSESHSASRAEGTGLGLSICKTIIEAHGGSISFKSAKGEGTTFYLTLPLS
ncbi:sensor histidine kinase [Gorillibacterium massiliense]|uniref:sensor histidine kinase n=1 Tax=Gorillibacterium massiliense TaxID=1280390 RepID=UPI0012DE29FC|nr:HAMP domain-containing sensor histidine kinase [Gorillibacterium massiliense]